MVNVQALDTKYHLKVIGQVTSQMFNNSVAKSHGKRKKYSKEHQVMTPLSIKTLSFLCHAMVSLRCREFALQKHVAR